MEAENQIYHFEDLTIRDDVDISVYKNALDYAFSKKKITNIAITGPYGAGKSSVLETYKKAHPRQLYLHISLATFTEEQKIKEENIDPLSSNENREETLNNPMWQNEEAILEGKILNHLIHQIKTARIPQTNFQIKRKSSIIASIIEMICVIVFVLCTLVVFLKQAIVDYLNSFSLPIFSFFIKALQNEIIYLICCAVLLVGCSLLIFWIIKNQNNRHIFKRLNIKGTEIEIFKESNDSFFDKYLNEVLYLFEQSDVDVIVFEDMDRFENNTIFSKLREINLLLDQRKTNDHTRKIIRFVYLLRDDVFVSKDRTKFFDFIIPIVPIIDRFNSFDYFLKEFEKYGLSNIIDNHFLKQVSLYIDDYRLLTNIINEYVVYDAKIRTTEQNNSKLLAMIIYKNIFPRDFSNLQLGKGFVFTIFTNKADLIDEKATSIKTEIHNTENALSAANGEHVRSKHELISLYLAWPDTTFQINGQKYSTLSTNLVKIISLMEAYPSSIRCLTNNYNSIFDYQHALSDLNNNSEYVNRLNTITIKTASASEELKLKLEGLRARLLKVHISKFKELITNENELLLFMSISKNELDEKYEYKEIKRSDYFYLLKFLIRNGWIDETYPDYMSYFIGISIGTNDKIFLRSITDRTKQEYSLILEHPDRVFSRLSVDDFKQPEILNLSLLNYILSQNDDKTIFSIITQIHQTYNYSLISDYMDSIEFNSSFIKKLFKNWKNFFRDIQENANYTQERLQLILQIIISDANQEEIIEIEEQNVISSYINHLPNFLVYAPTDQENFIRNIQALEIEFVDLNIDECNYELLRFVYNESLYDINISLINKLLTKFYNTYSEYQSTHENFSLIQSDNQSPIYSFIKSNMDIYMKTYLDSCAELINDKESAIAEILNDYTIDIEIKSKYIDYLSSPISVLKNITNPEIQVLLIDTNKILHTAENILFYYFSNNNLLDNHLISSINKQDSSMIYNPQTIKSEYGEKAVSQFMDSVIKENEIKTSLYLTILKQLKLVNINLTIETIHDDKILGLIKNDIIKMNAENIVFMRSNYPNCLAVFIIHNMNIYIQLLKNVELYNLDEVISLLELDISDSNKLALIRLSSESIHTKSLHVSSKVLLEILKNHFSDDELEYWVILYDNQNAAIRRVLLSQFVANIDKVCTLYILSAKLLNDMIDSNLIINAVILKLIASNLKNYQAQEASIILVKARLYGFESLLHRQSSTFEINSINEKILEAFKNQGWIKGYKIDKKNNSLYRAHGRNILW